MAEILNAPRPIAAALAQVVAGHACRHGENERDHHGHHAPAHALLQRERGASRIWRGCVQGLIVWNETIRPR